MNHAMMTLLKHQLACIFNLYEKKNDVYKYEKVKSCLETTMDKFKLGKEILGFTMCVRDKPIGRGLIHIKNSSSSVDKFQFLPAHGSSSRANVQTKKVPSYITEKLSLSKLQFPAHNKFVNFEITPLNFHGCKIFYDGEISCHLDNCKESTMADLCIRIVFKIFDSLSDFDVFFA